MDEGSRERAWSAQEDRSDKQVALCVFPFHTCLDLLVTRPSCFCFRSGEIKAAHDRYFFHLMLTFPTITASIRTLSLGELRGRCEGQVYTVHLPRREVETHDVGLL